MESEGMLLDCLLERFTFIDYDVALVRDQAASAIMNSILLDRLLKKQDKAYYDFIQSLCRSGQTHIAEILKQTEG